jgi:hypothetical protein
MTACLFSSVIIVPPYLVFEFYEVLFALFEGGEQDPTIERRLAFIKERGDRFEEPSEYVSNDVQILAPCPFKSFLQHLRM